MDENFTIELSTKDGTATQNDDYVPDHKIVVGAGFETYIAGNAGRKKVTCPLLILTAKTYIGAA